VARVSFKNKLVRSIQPTTLPDSGSMRAMTSVPQTFAYS